MTKCSRFKYLGMTIHQNGVCCKEVDLRIPKAWNQWRKLTDDLCDKIPCMLKVLVYKTAARPSLSYGNEAWPIKGHLADKMASCEMRMITYYLGVNREEHGRNEDIMREANVMPIKDIMRRKRLEWCGHVHRKSG